MSPRRSFKRSESSAKRMKGVRRFAAALPIVASISGAVDPAKASAFGLWGGNSGAAQQTAPPPNPRSRHTGSGVQNEAIHGPAADSKPDFLESLVGACTGGMVIGASTTEAVALLSLSGATPALPLVVSAVAVGCGVNMASTAVGMGSKAVWHNATH